MTEERKLIEGLRNMTRRIAEAAHLLRETGNRKGAERADRDCLLVNKAYKALETGPVARLMPVREVMENPETLVWLEHYRQVDNGPVLTPTALYPSDGQDADGAVHSGDGDADSPAFQDLPKIADFYCGDIYRVCDYGKTWRCWIGPMPSKVFRRSVSWDD